MRVAAHPSGKFTSSRPLTRRRPTVPAAVCLFDTTGRTNVLVLDLDAKDGRTPADVATDAQRAVAWIQECGGVAVVDVGTSGGRHVYVPLAGGEMISARHLEPVLRLLADRLPTLDVTPMRNPTQGCITVPGSSCKQGGYRWIDGSVDEAVDAFATRSAPHLIARLVGLLGGGLHATAFDISSESVLVRSRAGVAPLDDMNGRWESGGPTARLRSEWCLRSPLPTAVAHYARSGHLPEDGRWPSHSEARQSVLTAAALRGLTLDDVRHRIAIHDWPGLGNAYHRYGSNAGNQLQRDWVSAKRWVDRYAPSFQFPGHKTEHTGGSVCAPSSHPLTRWLAASYAWLDIEYSLSGPEHRERMRSVLQAIAWGTYITGGGSGVSSPTVAMGVRSLSLAAGLMPKTVVADILAELRERPGSPLLRIETGAGLLPDRYALVGPAITGEPVTPIHLDRVRVAPVHDAWRIIGLRGRRIYELILTTKLSRPDDLFAAARVGRSTGYAILADLHISGLINRSHAHASLGCVTLADIADAHDLTRLRAETVATYQRNRADWAAWLELAYAAARSIDPGPDPEISPLTPPWPDTTEDREAFWRSLFATGPPHDPFGQPPPDTDQHSTAATTEEADTAALQLLISELGATVIVEP